jgi:cytochrome c-type biogenesis protein CcmF
MPGGGQTFAARTYDAVARPVGILYVLIMAVCPLLSWGKTPGATMWQRLRWPLVTTAGILGLLVWEYSQTLRPIFNKLLDMQAQGTKTPVSLVGPPWWHEAQALIGFAVAALAISTSIWLFVDGARKRASARGEGFGTAMWAIMSKARTQTGGYMTHLGVGIILIGLIGSSMFVDDISVKVPAKQGEKFSVDRYTFTYQGLDETELPNGDQTATAKFAILKDGKPAGQIEPGQTSFATQGQTRLNAAVKSELLRDVFVVFQGMEDEQLSINVKINPLISFAWFGFALMLLGTTIAVWPKRGAEGVRVVEPAGAKKR